MERSVLLPLNIALLVMFPYWGFVARTSHDVTVADKAAQASLHKSERAIIKEGVGVAGIIVGESTSDDVIAMFGQQVDLIEHNGYSTEMKYTHLGMSFYYCLKDAKKRIFEINLFAPFAGKTTKGLMLGEATASDAVKLYGEPDWTTTESAESWWLEYEGVEFHVKKESLANQFPLDEAKYLMKTVIQISVVEKNPRNCRE